MKHFPVLAVVLLTLTLPVCLSAQHHNHARNEIGISGGTIYSFDHKNWGAGTHVHYYRTLDDHSKWSWGAMAEYANVHGGHFTVGAGIKYQLIDRLSIGILPGVTFMKHDHNDHDDHTDHDKKTMFSAHAELVYDLFRWENLVMMPKSADFGIYI